MSLLFPLLTNVAQYNTIIINLLFYWNQQFLIGWNTECRKLASWHWKSIEYLMKGYSAVPYIPTSISGLALVIELGPPKDRGKLRVGNALPSRCVSSSPIERKQFLTSSELGKNGYKGCAMSQWSFSRLFWTSILCCWRGVVIISWSKTHQCLLSCCRGMQAWLVVLWRHLLFNQQDMQNMDRGAKSLQLLPCQPC